MAFDFSKGSTVPSAPAPTKGGFDFSKGSTGFGDAKSALAQSQAKLDQIKKPSTLEDFSTGMGQVALNTIQGAGTLGTSLYKNTLGKIEELFTKKPVQGSPYYTPGTPEYQKIQEADTPQNNAQKAGYVTGYIGQLLAPSGALSKAETGLGTMIADSALSPTAQAVARVGGKAALEGAAGGLTTAVQTGSASEGVKSGAISAGIGATLHGVGEVSKAFKLPERIYSTVFKNSYEDTLAELSTQGVSDLQKTDPTKFKEFVDQGIIKLGKDGAPIVDETLAKEALDRGLKGSIDTMSNTVVKNKFSLEQKAQELAKNYTERIPIEKQYTKILQKVEQTYGDIGFGEYADKAGEMLGKIKDGSVDATTALELRRFLDSLRKPATFSTDVPLALSQQNLKTLADTLRGKLAKIPEFADTMNDYRFNIDALEALAREAKRRGNNNLVSFLDAAIFGGGAALGGTLGGVGLAAARKATTMPSLMTRVAQGLNKVGPVSKLGVLLRGGASQAIRGATDTESPQNQ